MDIKIQQATESEIQAIESRYDMSVPNATEEDYIALLESSPTDFKDAPVTVCPVLWQAVKIYKGIRYSIEALQDHQISWNK